MLPVSYVKNKKINVLIFVIKQSHRMSSQQILVNGIKLQEQCCIEMNNKKTFNLLKTIYLYI